MRAPLEKIAKTHKESAESNLDSALQVEKSLTKNP